MVANNVYIILVSAFSAIGVVSSAIVIIVFISQKQASPNHI